MSTLTPVSGPSFAPILVHPLLRRLVEVAAVEKPKKKVPKSYQLEDFVLWMADISRMSRRSFLRGLAAAAKLVGLGINPLKPQDPLAHLGTPEYRHAMIRQIHKKWPTTFATAYDWLFEGRAVNLNKEKFIAVNAYDDDSVTYSYNAPLLEEVLLKAGPHRGLGTLRKILRGEILECKSHADSDKHCLMEAQQAAMFLSNSFGFAGLTRILDSKEHQFFCELFGVEDLVFPDYVHGPFALPLYRMMKSSGWKGLDSDARALREAGMLEEEVATESKSDTFQAQRGGYDDLFLALMGRAPAIFEGVESPREFAAWLHSAPDPRDSSPKQFED